MNNNFLSQFRSPLRYALLGMLACVVATLAAEIIIRRFAPSSQAFNPDDPLVIAMLLDVSGSMEGEPILEVREAAGEFLDTWDRSETYVAVITFSSDTELLEPILKPGQSSPALREQIAGLASESGTNMALALARAEDVFAEIGSTRNAVMLFTDGVPSDRLRTLRQARAMRERGIVIVGIGTDDADQGLLRRLAGGDDAKVFTTRLGDFANAFEKAAQAISASAFGTESARQGFALVAVVALALAAALLAAENVWGLRGRWWRDLYWLPAFALLLGVISAVIGEALGLRVLTWTLVGLAMGVALGLTDATGIRFLFNPGRWWSDLPLKSRRGALFGLIGGLAGGWLFSQIFSDTALGTSGGAWLALFSRLIGFAVVGFFIGLALKFGEEMLKDAWLMGTTRGFYEGKRYILAKPRVTVGRRGSNDINLARERVPRAAGHFVKEGRIWFFQPARNVDAVAVNGNAIIHKTPLEDGAAIRFGQTEFAFRQRGDPGRIARALPWALAGDSAVYALPHQDKISVGRDAACDIVLEDPSVQPRHCTLEFTRRGLCLRARAGSRVSINNQKLTASTRRVLAQGDLLVIGEVELGLIVLNTAASVAPDANEGQ